jgi:AcrR family transcriptional regulator
MRRHHRAVGIRAPSLYKHFPEKTAVEIALINDGFAEIAERFGVALASSEDSLVELAAAYRAFVRSHWRLYRLMTAGPLPREHLRPGVEARHGADRAGGPRPGPGASRLSLRPRQGLGSFLPRPSAAAGQPSGRIASRSSSSDEGIRGSAEGPDRLATKGHRCDWVSL